MEKASSPPNNCPIPWQRSFPFQQPSPFCHPERTRISYFRSSHRCHLCGSPQREPHAVVRSRNPRQEIRGSRGICGAPFGCPKFTVLPLSLCHPEWSASQICRVNSVWWRGVEEPLSPGCQALSGRGFNRVALTMLKIAVLAPIPRTKVASAVIVMRGDFRMVLRENCTPFHKLICTSRRTSKAWKSGFPLYQSSTHVEPTNFTRT